MTGCESSECTKDALYIVTIVGNYYDNMDPGVNLYCNTHMLEAEKTADKCGVTCVIRAYPSVSKIYSPSK